MESQIKWKDVAHLYIGCRLIGLQTKRVLENTASVLAHCEWDKTKIMPVLKQYDISASMANLSAIGMKDLLSEGYDLFGLIDSGEALDAASFEVNPYSVEPVPSYGAAMKVFIKKSEK